MMTAKMQLERAEWDAMSTTLSRPTASLEIPKLPLRRFSVDEYHRMIQSGILTEDDPVELLDGLIVTKSHAATEDEFVLPTDRDGKLLVAFPLPIHKFTLAQYHRMIPAGVLLEGGPEELLDGW